MFLVSDYSFFFSSRRRHTRLQGDWVQTCALPICKLGQKLGLLAKKTHLDLLGFKRKKITSTNIRIEQQDIFDKSLDRKSVV